MRETRKVHRFGFAGQGRPQAPRRHWNRNPIASAARHWNRNPIASAARHTTKAACGVMLYPGTPDCGYGVIDRVFKSFPVERRCWTCEHKWQHLLAPPKEAFEWVATAETIVLAIDRLGQAARNYPHAERGCYFRQDPTDGRDNGTGDHPVCWCGRISRTDTRFAERWAGKLAGETPYRLWATWVCKGCGALYSEAHVQLCWACADAASPARLKRRERDAGGVLETERVLDFGGGV